MYVCIKQQKNIFEKVANERMIRAKRVESIFCLKEIWGSLISFVYKVSSVEQMPHTSYATEQSV